MTMAGPKTETQYVTFSLGEEVFAVPVEVVREILDFETPFKIPQGPAHLLGLRDVRGQGVPILDMRERLGMSPTVRTLNTRVLVLDIPIADKMLVLGLVADRVFEVVPFRSDMVEEAPEIGTSWQSDYIAGVVRRPEGFVVIIDLARMFSGDAGLQSLSQAGVRNVA